MDNIDLEELILKNQEKLKKKLAKKGMSPEKINQQARMNVRNIHDAVKATEQMAEEKSEASAQRKAEKIKKSTEYYKNTTAKPGSLAAKANMVKQFDDKNKTRKK